MATIVMIMNLLLKMSVYMKGCKKVFVCSNKLALLKLETIKKWKTSWNNSINDTYKVYKGLLFQEWSKTNCYWPVGTWLTVLVSSKSKQPKFKSSVWLIRQMDVVVIVLLTSHKRRELQGKIWTKNHKNPKYQEQKLIFVN